MGSHGRRWLIHHLAVAVSHRRQGIGKRLVAEGLAALGRAGIQKCHLLVFGDNPEGRAFWRAVGAQNREELAVCSLPTDFAVRSLCAGH